MERERYGGEVSSGTLRSYCLHLPLGFLRTIQQCQSWKGLRDHMAQSPRFTDEETEARRTLGGFLREVLPGLGHGTWPPFPNCSLPAGSRLRQAQDI